MIDLMIKGTNSSRFWDSGLRMSPLLFHFYYQSSQHISMFLDSEEPPPNPSLLYLPNLTRPQPNALGLDRLPPHHHPQLPHHLRLPATLLRHRLRHRGHHPLRHRLAHGINLRHPKIPLPQRPRSRRLSMRCRSIQGKLATIHTADWLLLTTTPVHTPPKLLRRNRPPIRHLHRRRRPRLKPLHPWRRIIRALRLDPRPHLPHHLTHVRLRPESARTPRSEEALREGHELGGVCHVFKENEYSDSVSAGDL